MCVLNTAYRQWLVSVETCWDYTTNCLVTYPLHSYGCKLHPRAYNPSWLIMTRAWDVSRASMQWIRLQFEQAANIHQPASIMIATCASAVHSLFYATITISSGSVFHCGKIETWQIWILFHPLLNSPDRLNSSHKIPQLSNISDCLTGFNAFIHFFIKTSLSIKTLQLSKYEIQVQNSLLNCRAAQVRTHLNITGNLQYTAISTATAPQTLTMPTEALTPFIQVQ
jgi:hypothetical protein